MATMEPPSPITRAAPISDPRAADVPPAPEVPPAQALPPAPYVGMRPFSSAERDVFVGRGADAERLTDKIFSSRFTVVYGASGVGKSSLLSTLVVPRLVEQDAEVIWFDAWRGEDPVAELRDALCDAVRRAGSATPAAGAASLAEHVRRLSEATARTVVLILDQLEELFTSRRPLDDVRREAGLLARAEDVDVRIVFSLREEHLASLEPLRLEVPTLFQSTCRIASLGMGRAREAIAGPAEKFGVTCEPALITAILDAVRLDGTADAVDLPILQLVCDEIWKAARPGPGAVLTLAHYQELGGKEGILRAFLERVMPHGWSARLRTARLMLHLAPPDGHKMSFSSDHLASLTRLRKDRVDGELERLASGDAMVLRSRNYGRAVLYELRHDAFVRILTPWRDRLLRRARILRRAAAFAGACVLAIFVGAFGLSTAIDERRNTDDVLADLALPAEQRLDRVASYLLWTRSGTSRLERLRELLTSEKAPGIPRKYGIEASGVEFIQPPDDKDPWPLTLEYSTDRPLDPLFFEQAWQGLPKVFIDEWRIPVPLQLKLVPVTSFPRKLVRLSGSALEPLEQNFPSDEDQVLLYSRDLQPPGREFMARFSRDWRPISIPDKPPWWWVVPRWSLPVWKATGGSTTEGSGILAFRLALTLQDQPERLLTSEAVDALLRDAERGHPDTVAEARAARGDRLTHDLAELARRGRSLKHFDLILDLLAGVPREASSADAAEALTRGEAVRQQRSGRATGPQVRGAIERVDDTLDRIPEGGPIARSMPRGYRAVLRWLPPLEKPVRIALSDDLATALVRDGETAELGLTLERVRDDMMRRHGMGEFPHDVRLDHSLPPGTFRIEVLEDPDRCEGAGRRAATCGRSLQELAQALELRLGIDRALLLRAETVKAQLRILRPGVRAWLAARWSLTDLKRIERVVLAPGAEEVAAYRQALEGRRQPSTAPPGSSIRDPAWLLPSLVFWSRVDDGASVAAMGARLRATQAGRGGAPPGSVPPEVSALVHEGIAALGADRPAQAAEAFDQALARDRGAAIASFQGAWSGERSRAFEAVLASKCRSPDDAAWGRLGRSERLTLADAVSGPAFGAGKAAERRRLSLCLLAALPLTADEEERIALARRILVDHGDPAPWRPEEAAWFAQRLASLGAGDLVDRAAAFAESAITRLPPDRARAFLVALADVCLDDGPRRRCRERLPAVAAASDLPELWIAVASRLATQASERERTAALRLSERALDLPGGLTPRLRSVAELAHTVAMLRSPQGRADRRALAKLEALAAEDSAATSQLVRILVARGDDAEASRRLRIGSALWPLDLGLLSAQLSVALSAGDTPAVRAVCSSADRFREGRFPDPRSRGRFLATLARVVTRTEDWERVAREFLETRSDEVPYVAMLLAARMGETAPAEARAILERRWRDAAPGTWDARLEEGDLGAWREMLVGFSLGKVERERVFGALEDEARFTGSPLRNLSLSRKGLLCQAHFYEALVVGARGDRDGERRSLQRAVQTGEVEAFEYAMARYLLMTELAPGGS